MRKLILHSILLLSVFCISSCNYLDVDKWFDDTMKYDSIFSRKEYLERYMWNVASMFPDEGNFLNNPATPGPLATVRLLRLLMQAPMQVWHLLPAPLTKKTSVGKPFINGIRCIKSSVRQTSFCHAWTK